MKLHFLALLELNFIHRAIILLLSTDLLLTFNSHTQMHGEYIQQSSKPNFFSEPLNATNSAFKTPALTG